MTDHVDCIVIGAGIIGLAVARSLAMSGRQVIVLEADSTIASHTSSRNSEVIHAGIYYPNGSLKATTCVSGRQSLYEYCEAKGVPYRRIGKIIVATRDSQLTILDDYLRRANANGVMDLKRLSASDVKALEPEVLAVGGLLSPSTGIVDSHSLLLALQADIEAHEGMVVLQSRVVGANVQAGGFRLFVEGDEGFSVTCKELVNAAGLWATDVAKLINGVRPARIPRTYYAKGHYFSLQGPSPFKRLVYPVAGLGGLGIHVTLDLAGQAKFGPDVEWVQEVDYAFDGSRLSAFEGAIRRYYPALPEGRLSPAYTGIRPKLTRSGEEPADFVIQGEREHGIPGLVNLLGIESPGLTAALSVAELVEQKIESLAVS